MVSLRSNEQDSRFIQRLTAKENGVLLHQHMLPHGISGSHRFSGTRHSDAEDETESSLGLYRRIDDGEEKASLHLARRSLN